MKEGNIGGEIGCVAELNLRRRTPIDKRLLLRTP